MDPATDPPHPFDRAHRATYRRAGAIAGAVLVAAAAWTALRDQAILDSLDRAWRSPDWLALAVLVGAILANQALTSLTFVLLLRPHGPVRFGEMNALVAVSTLGNYVPMQAGSIGRLAYHRAVHGIPVRTGLIAILQAMAATLGATLLVGGAWYAMARADGPWWLPLAIPLAWLPFAARAGWSRAATVMAVRSAEVLVWAVHAWAAFRLSGWPVEPRTALGAALLASAANLVPFIGNGLGVREWAVALAAPFLGGYERDAGLAAELAGRAVDVAVAVPLGLAGISALLRRVRSAPRSTDG